MFAALKAALGIADWPQFTREEVAAHNTPDSVWIVAGDRVFDVTDFVKLHPAGPLAIMKRAGGCADCTRDIGFHSKGAREQWNRCQVGVLSPAALKAPIPANAAPAAAVLAAMDKPLNYHGSKAEASNAEPSKAEPSKAAPSKAEASNAEPLSVSDVAPLDDMLSDDGGEDCIAAGHCCRETAPTAACRTCPHAPRCARKAAASGVSCAPCGKAVDAASARDPVRSIGL